MAAAGEDGACVRLLCSRRSLISMASPPPGIVWLIGSPLFLPSHTVAAAFRCLCHLPGGSPDLPAEASDISALLVRGFDIVGALFAGRESDPVAAIGAARVLRKHIFGDVGTHDMIGAVVAEGRPDDLRFFISSDSEPTRVSPRNAIFNGSAETSLWDQGCLLHCELPLKLPFYASTDGRPDFESAFSSLIESAATKFRDRQVAYLVEGSALQQQSLVISSEELGFTGKQPNESVLHCSLLCSTPGSKSVDVITVTMLSNRSLGGAKGAPAIEYVQAPAPTTLSTINLKLDVLCYSSRDFPVRSAVSELVIPSLIDQLHAIKNTVLSDKLGDHAQLHPYHFLPSGVLIPVTAIYDLSYGEMEEKQSKLRSSLHLRLGLALDRPLLRVSNAASFGPKGGKDATSSSSRGVPLLRDVHREIPSSGISKGTISVINGSYEYYHYLHDGVDDDGWGCAYRSLQTIISWYRLQQYTTIPVPSHREIQQALVEIGDKDPSFIGSREWIGAIELSFVLDKLLGVSCKVINVRSGDELPEKCRELAAHFETQGTPVMIGGGVLAYTLLGVDYSEASGDSAFLILDPHYTGADDLKKIVNAGWCGWKKAVDGKGKSFFLKDKFYNLLLPQRPNMV